MTKKEKGQKKQADQAMKNIFKKFGPDTGVKSTKEMAIELKKIGFPSLAALISNED